MPTTNIVTHEVSIGPTNNALVVKANGEDLAASAISWEHTQEGLALTVDTKRNLTKGFSALPWVAGADWAVIQYDEDTRKTYISAEDAEDGWATIYFDPAGRINSNIATQAAPKARNDIVVGAPYTLMIELDQFSSQPTGAALNIYRNASRDQVAALGGGSLVSYDLTEGVLYVPMVGAAPAGDKRLLQVEVKKNTYTGYFRGRIRFSLYEGEYAGPYIPWEGN